MKTAVSIPDDIFERAEQLPARKRMSRSALYALALSEYVARHAPSDITEAMNSVCDQVGERKDPFVAAAARRILENAEW